IEAACRRGARADSRGQYEGPQEHGRPARAGTERHAGDRCATGLHDRQRRQEIPLRGITEAITMPINLNRREVATVIAGLHLLAGDGVRAPNYPRTLLATLAPDAQTEYELR